MYLSIWYPFLHKMRNMISIYWLLKYFLYLSVWYPFLHKRRNMIIKMRYRLCEVLSFIIICDSAQKTYAHMLPGVAIQWCLMLISQGEINHCFSDLIHMDTFCFRYGLYLNVHLDLQSCVKQLYLWLDLMHFKDSSNSDIALVTHKPVTLDI